MNLYCYIQVLEKKLSRKVMIRFVDIAIKDIKSRKAFRKKYFPHVENFLLIDIKNMEI